MSKLVRFFAYQINMFKLVDLLNTKYTCFNWFVIPPYEVYRWYIVFAFFVIMFVCVFVCLFVCLSTFFRQRFLSNYFG